MPKPCEPLHPTPHPECPICWRAEHSRAHQRLWGLPVTGQSADARQAPRFTAPVSGPFALPTVCPHEGTVLEFCTTCQGEMKHVRECDVFDKCTRGPNQVGMASCASCPEHPERKRVMRWSYGVTTVPQRRGSLLPRTLNSLKNAGFDRPRLFVDGERDAASWEREFGLEVTARFPNVRTHGNWVLSMYELWIRDPQADRFAIFQDDMVTMRGLRTYLERTTTAERAYWNLYTFPENEMVAAKVEGVKRGWFKSNQCGRGAVALVFSRDGVKRILHQAHMVDRVEDVHRGHKAVDGGIVTAMGRFDQSQDVGRDGKPLPGWIEMCHTPSLVQHTGTISSMRSAPHPSSRTFLGEDCDATEVFK